MNALDEVLQDAKEQYGVVGAMAYTVKQAAAELVDLQNEVAALRIYKSVTEPRYQAIEAAAREVVKNRHSASTPAYKLFDAIKKLESELNKE